METVYYKGARWKDMREELNVGLISLYDIENNAIRSIASVLRKNGFRVFEIYLKNWVNNRISLPNNNELDNLISILRDNHVNLAGISLRASAYSGIAAIITGKIKEALGIPVVWGGLHPTLVPEECIRVADIICRGEGEYAMLELMKNISENKPVKDIANLWVKTENGVIRENDIRALVEDLDSIPFLDYTSKDKYYLENKNIFTGDPLVKKPMFRIMASRGCLFNCSYCYNSALRKIYQGKGRYFRYRSVNNVIGELLRAKTVFKNLKYIRFDDEMFIFDNNWIKEFSGEYKKHINLPFECFVYPGNYQEELLQGLKEAGLRVVYMGIEGPESVNKTLYRRNFSEEDISRNVKIFHKLGLGARYQVILDDPVSGEEDKKMFFEFLMGFPRPFELYLFSLTFFPKTELSERLLAQGAISEGSIEGRASKTFSQLRVDLSFPRLKPDQFWVSLIVLISINFIPKKLIKALSKNKFLYKHPKPLVIFSRFCSLIKMFWIFVGMVMRGQMSADLFRQWFNPSSLVTQ